MRWLYVALGLFFSFLGILGAFLPLMPSTIFFIIAAYFFARSSTRLYNMLMNSPFGNHVETWYRERKMPFKAKLIALSFTFLGTLLAFLTSLKSSYVLASVVLVLGAVLFLIVLSIPTTKA